MTSARCWFVVTSLAVLLTASTGCSTAPAELTLVRTTADGQNVLEAYKTQTRIRAIVVFFHGLDRDENILDLDQPHEALIHALTDAGYAVVASAAGGNAFGNPASQQNYAALARESSERYGTNEIFFLSESMGTVAAVNLMAKDDGISVRGLAAINPLLNLGHIPPTYRFAAQASYDGSSPATESPLALPSNDLAGRHLRFYVTPTDSVVPTDANALAFQQRFSGVADASIEECSGDHLDPSCIQGGDIVRWFSSLL